MENLEKGVCEVVWTSVGSGGDWCGELWGLVETGREVVGSGVWSGLNWCEEWWGLVYGVVWTLWGVVRTGVRSGGDLCGE